jgi:hypothetical protein
MEDKMEIRFNDFFDKSDSIDSGMAESEVVKISIWAKEVLKSGYFNKMINNMSTDMMTSILDCDNKSTVEVVSQIKGALRVLRSFSIEIERLSNLK